ncbi:hypothetical protein EDB81DRAFT_888740 [Dactylonectria macrodidyma]|uniref:Isopenicillin N synthase-like Fe(2+) 2OG dioxygenase domain-containing protein n=1 Tax=Dactylonectria macrodidyma TaxID=307937 RepID=A0A9P9E071_9HYPO|nr:hypothetical protein EDB81DRAFT_888740 [Dactylonectria macrodidyma]
MAFLDGRNVTKLEVMNYERLKSRHPEEIKKLVQASQGGGVFFLDLRGPAANDALSDLQHIYTAQLQFFQKASEDDKKASSAEEGQGGYQKHGDVELFNIPRVQELQGSYTLPIALDAVAPKLSSVSSFCDPVTRELFTLLVTSLDPPSPTTAGDNPEQPGASLFQLGYSVAPAGELLVPSHTGDGLVTLLFYREPSLEVPLEGNSEDWGIVEPIEGHHLVYIAKALQKISGDRLRAPLHRVVEPREGAYLSVYLLHPSPQ